MLFGGAQRSCESNLEGAAKQLDLQSTLGYTGDKTPESHFRRAGLTMRKKHRLNARITPGAKSFSGEKLLEVHVAPCILKENTSCGASALQDF